MGVVYHANYLIWFDRARTELMRETGLRSEEHTSELQSRQYLPSFPTRRSSDLKLGTTERGRKRLSYLTFRGATRILPRRDQRDNAPRQLLRDRSDGGGLPRQLPHLVRPGPHRADARNGPEIGRAHV